MKHALFTFLTLFLFTGCSIQPHVATENAKVVTVTGQSQKQIYNKARQWFSTYFVSGESVVDYEDASAGTIIGKGIGTAGVEALGLIKAGIHYTIRVDTKSGRMRVTTTIIKHTNDDGKSVYDVAHVTPARVAKAEAKMASVVASLENYVNGRTGSASSNW